MGPEVSDSISGNYVFILTVGQFNGEEKRVFKITGPLVMLVLLYDRIVFHIKHFFTRLSDNRPQFARANTLEHLKDGCNNLTQYKMSPQAAGVS